MLYIGIDIAKRSHQVAILNAEGLPMGKSFSIPNRRAGVEHLMKRIASVNLNNEPLHFGLEATGHYWVALYCSLEDAGCQVTVLNPMRSAAYRKLQLRPVKTDRVDARCIAEIIRLLPPSRTPYTDDKLFGLRQLTRLRRELVERNAIAKRQTLAIIDRVFPEFETLFSHVFCKTARAILKAFGTPARIAELDIDEFAQFVHQQSGGKVKRARAERILEAAKGSFSARIGQAVAHLQLKIHLEQMEFIDAQIDTINLEIDSYMQEIPQTLTTIPGISDGLAATIISEIGTIQRFDSGHALVAYAGIDPRVFQSGEYTAKNAHLSKRGSPYLRLAIWQAATGASRCDPALRYLLKRKQAEGKPYQVALGAVANKLIHIIYALLRDNKPYVSVLPQSKGTG